CFILGIVPTVPESTPEELKKLACKIVRNGNRYYHSLVQPGAISSLLAPTLLRIHTRCVFGIVHTHFAFPNIYFRLNYHPLCNKSCFLSDAYISHSPLLPIHSMLFSRP